MISDKNKKSMSGKLQVYEIGDSVEVILSLKNKTYHAGLIRDIKWHHKDNRWNYYIEVNSRKISKRYDECDLRNTK